MRSVGANSGLRCQKTKKIISTTVHVMLALP